MHQKSTTRYEYKAGRDTRQGTLLEPNRCTVWYRLSENRTRRRQDKKLRGVPAGRGTGRFPGKAVRRQTGAAGRQAFLNKYKIKCVRADLSPVRRGPLSVLPAHLPVHVCGFAGRAMRRAALPPYEGPCGALAGPCTPGNHFFNARGTCAAAPRGRSPHGFPICL